MPLRQAMELTRRLHGHENNLMYCQLPLQALEPDAVVGNAQTLANGMDIDVEPPFTDVEADVDSSRCASFGRNLAFGQDKREG
ncbi:MAG: hypothetical protein AB7O44_17045 [Hyphomicrobiaceae bacterium]